MRVLVGMKAFEGGVTGRFGKTDGGTGVLVGGEGVEIQMVDQTWRSFSSTVTSDQSCQRRTMLFLVI